MCARFASGSQADQPAIIVLRTAFASGKLCVHKVCEHSQAIKIASWPSVAQLADLASYAHARFLIVRELECTRFCQFNGQDV